MNDPLNPEDGVWTSGQGLHVLFRIEPGLPCAELRGLFAALDGFSRLTPTAMGEEAEMLVVLASTPETALRILAEEQSRRAEERYNLVLLDTQDTDLRLQLMDAGAHSVLPPPADAALFERILETAIQRTASRQARSLELTSMADTARTALRTASEIGMLLQFLQQVNLLSSAERLAGVMLDFNRQLGLNVALSLEINQAESRWSTEGPLTAMQSALLDNLSQRIVQKGRILGLKGETTAWLCSGPLLADEDFSGRMRDILIQAVDIVDSRVRSVEIVALIREQHGQLYNVIQLMQNAQGDSQKATQHIMQKLAEDIAMAAVSLDLTHEQEEHLLSLSRTALDQMDNLFSGFMLLENHFRSVLSGLDKVRTLADATVVAEPEASQDDGGVELF